LRAVERSALAFAAAFVRADRAAAFFDAILIAASDTRSPGFRFFRAG
jgi:hypothetical protein